MERHRHDIVSLYVCKFHRQIVKKAQLQRSTQSCKSINILTVNVIVIITILVLRYSLSLINCFKVDSVAAANLKLLQGCE